MWFPAIGHCGARVGLARHACSRVPMLDGGWGRAPQPHAGAGEDGKDIRVTIRKTIAEID